ncbi:dihydrolipoyl dehydrogenase [Candidatus Hydrogenosomobacter endosymbioticus]|uniref:Dihydrolipoyl dehydrogenase n=1 Tax=Candidatus Hydrogenosomobacter endosymbioticus TaxID=2558174 RepID=A0ABN6L3H7_9PROT|nr:dihydrolipoyl dehydrogenase [Candidatus Hydrogenosomobacter endosymbioticus]BDB96508.1 dihydrolipoyl dehydrogenase [Candidatus Hydrogenosomobacter endosymbioticus]
MVDGFERFDVVVLGAGPGGYVAAIRAAQLGFSVAVVEKDKLGGVCLNCGCIPTKAFLKSAKLLRLLSDSKKLAFHGIKTGDVSIDFAEMAINSRSVIEKLSSGIAGLLKKNGVRVFRAAASIKSKSVDGFIVSIFEGSGVSSEIAASKVIVATGSKPQSIPGFDIDGKYLWSYKEALSADRAPRSMMIIGAGAIGIEFANIFHSFGTEVTVVEARDRILPSEDEDVSGYVCNMLSERGIKFFFEQKALWSRRNDVEGVVDVAIESVDGSSHVWSGEKVLVAVGVAGNSSGIGLENTMAKVEKGRIVVYDFGLTDEPGLYAIGDVASTTPWLAHKASHEGILCVEHMAGAAVGPMDYSSIPVCVYGYPQTASVGISERQARDMGRKIKVGRFPFTANGYAVSQGESDGFAKVIFDENTGELLGAHLVGAEVSELIHAVTTAKAAEATDEELAHSVFSHPSFCEAIHEAVLNAYDRALHI